MKIIAIVVRILLNECMLSDENINQLAAACKSLKAELEFLRERWVAIRKWKRRIVRVHDIILTAGVLIPCVEDGRKTFATLCSRPPNIKKLNMRACIDYWIACKSVYAEDGECWCDNPYGQDGDYVPDKKQQSQHTYFYYSSVSLTKEGEWFTQIYLSHAHLTNSVGPCCACKSCVTTGLPHPDCTFLV